MIEIPLSKPEILPEDKAAVAAVLDSGRLAMGQVQLDFEEAFAHMNGVPHAVSVSSGTAALHLATCLAGIKPGDEVIVSPFSFVASANVVLYRQARPVFADIETDTYGIDPELVSDKVTGHTRAILPTHVFGQACRIGEIATIAEQHGLALIEDNCESLGAGVPVAGRDRLAGQFGDFVAYGFYPNKLVSTGEGGMLTLQSADQAEIARSLRNQGRTGGQNIHHIFDMLGYNYRMSELQAALGLSQLGRLTTTIQKRRAAAARYRDLLEGVEGVTLPGSPEGYGHTWFVFSIRVPAHRRDQVILYLSAHGIESRAYFYPPIHLQPYYRRTFGFQEGDFPVAEQVAREIIALPMYNQITDSQIDRVVEAVAKALKS